MEELEYMLDPDDAWLYELYETKKKEKKHNPYGGVCNWISNQYMNHGWNNKQIKVVDRVIMEYNNEVLHSDRSKPSTVAGLISQNFKQFTNWFKNKYQK